MIYRLSNAAGVLLATFVLAGCSDDAASPTGMASERTGQSISSADKAPGSGAQESAPTPARWYETEQVQRGAVLYAQNCAACHGDVGQGTFAWRKKDSEGKFPPPPLNGTAHTWHHPLRVLGAQIKFGAPGGQGMMPGFAQTLSDEKVLDVIAWFQDRWSNEIYAQWFETEMRSRASRQ